MASPDDIVMLSDSDDEVKVTSSTEAARRNSLQLILQQRILDTWNEMDSNKQQKLVTKVEKKEPNEEEVTSATTLEQLIEAVLDSSTVDRPLNVKDEPPPMEQAMDDNYVTTSQNKEEEEQEDYESDETVVFSDDPEIIDLFSPNRNPNQGGAVQDPAIIDIFSPNRNQHQHQDSAVQAKTSLEWIDVKREINEKYSAANGTVSPTKMDDCWNTLGMLFNPMTATGNTSTSSPKKDVDSGKQLSQMEETLIIPLVGVDAAADSDWSVQNSEYK